MDFETNPNKSDPKKAAASISTPVVPADTQKEDSAAQAKPKPKYDPLLLASIFDEILFSGEYTEEMTIKGRLKVKFRTRTAEEVSFISNKVDGTSANLMSTLNEQRSLLNLYYALVEYQGKSLATLKYEEREAFVKRLAAPVIGALMISLADFDAKVYASCQEGEENF